jgi:putative flippase GtrA
MINKVREIKIKLLESENYFLKMRLSRSVLNMVLTFNFLRYLIIGFSTFFMQIILLYFFNQTIGLEKVSANVISTLLSMIFNFLMSNYWTFKAGSSSQGKKLGKYLSLAAFNYIFDTMLAFPFLVMNLGMNQYLAKVVITGFIVAWNYFIYKLWIFKN